MSESDSNFQRASCLLCPQHCTLKPGQTGRCHTRINREGQIVPLTYGEVAAWHVDPIEKKPLYHFYPGSYIFSVAGFGCNLSCSFCQNYQISQVRYEGRKVTPEELAREAKDSLGICFTYSEPSIWYEMILDTAPLVRKQGGKVVLVSNGIISPHLLSQLIPWVDAVNIDIKAFSEEFYQKYCGGKLSWVLDNVERWAGSAHLEVTTLVIPGANDDPAEIRELAKWLANLGIPLAWHLSRYYPVYKLSTPPTELRTLEKLSRIAREYIPYVYLGNVSEGDKTYCPRCHTAVIRRTPFVESVLVNGCCPSCGEEIFGVGM